ncbi:MAG: hypothetical protein VB055_00760 [Oscillospiraceae bacterium]|nr:hypothetical protein [Oscillospiraceae bacterium]
MRKRTDLGKAGPADLGMVRSNIDILRAFCHHTVKQRLIGAVGRDAFPLTDAVDRQKYMISLILCELPLRVAAMGKAILNRLPEESREKAVRRSILSQWQLSW